MHSARALRIGVLMNTSHVSVIAEVIVRLASRGALLTVLYLFSQASSSPRGCVFKTSDGSAHPRRAVRTP
jgi:hypothetical protein